MARISVGMPVYNAERYLAQAIDSVLGQTCADFELVISDNASTDATATICEEYAVRYAALGSDEVVMDSGGTTSISTCRVASGSTPLLALTVIV